MKRKTGVEEEVLIPAAAHVHTRRKSKKDRKKSAPSNKVGRGEGGIDRKGGEEGGREERGGIDREEGGG